MNSTTLTIKHNNNMNNVLERFSKSNFDVLVWGDQYTKLDCRRNKDKIFVYEENFDRVGDDNGQTTIRNEPNSVGLITKISPSLCMSDENYAWNVYIIDLCLVSILANSIRKNKSVVLSQFGYGHDLRVSAQDTFNYLSKRMYDIFGATLTPNPLVK